MSLSKRKALSGAGPTRNRGKEVVDTSQHGKTMEDIPPEVVTIILEHLIRNERRHKILGYRLVNSQWKDIISHLLEKKIISGEFPMFPAMRAPSVNGHDLLFVSHSPTMLPADRNPFPSNSLVLCGVAGNFFPGSVSDIQRMAVADFASRFGGYLTSLSLHGLIVPGIKSLITLLGFVPNLKVLRFKEVKLNDRDRIIKPNGALPKPPPLPNLTTLEIETVVGSFTPREVNETRIMDVWIIVSYARQLVRLNLETDKPLPALPNGKHYIQSLRKDNPLYIAFMSRSAFGKVKELSIHRPMNTFLLLTAFPKLQQLTITDRASDVDGDFLDVIRFISKCRNTLEKLRLDVSWKKLMGREAINRYNREGFTLEPAICGEEVDPFPKLKTLEIQYYCEYPEDIMMSRFVALFPNLETLHFLCFPTFHIATANEVKPEKSDEQRKHADEILAIKARYTSLVHDMETKRQNFYQQLGAYLRQGWNGGYDLREEIRGFWEAAVNEMTNIFKRLAALGLKKQDVIVEEVLERQGIWNSCANLQVVFVKEWSKEENVCVIRRTDEA